MPYSCQYDFNYPFDSLFEVQEHFYQWQNVMLHFILVHQSVYINAISSDYEMEFVFIFHVFTVLAVYYYFMMEHGSHLPATNSYSVSVIELHRHSCIL